MSPFTFINQQWFSTEGYQYLELADINLRTHSAIEKREEIELSLVFHNRGKAALNFDYDHIKAEDVGTYKFIHIDYIKSPNEKLNYTLRQKDPIIFFERYETSTFEE